jgi:pimeloyl-ACP methyl ester carboxylesterase
MSLFCLVHGAFQGTWCWDLLIPYLEAEGHKTVTMDLPIENASATLSQFADVVIQGLPKTDDIVLVGHSMAGTIIPLVAEAVKVRQLVFVGGLIPYPGISTLDQFSHHLDADTLKSLNYQPKNPSKLEQFHSEPGQAKAQYMPNDTIEGASLALAIAPTVENMIQQGNLDAKALPLLLTMIDIVYHDAPVDIPWDKFFVGYSPI